MVRWLACRRVARRAGQTRAIAAATHELEWHPAWAIGGTGAWTLRAYGTADCDRTDLPQDIRPSVLAEWVAGQVGVPVVLTPSLTARFRADHTHEYCLTYWVTPSHLLVSAGRWQ